jgi:hypothetical protein
MNETTPSMEAINAAFTKFTNSISPELKQRMNGRLERGLEIALSSGVIPYDPTTLVQFKVMSSDPAKLPYMVDLRARTCTCPDHLKGHYCKHRVAAQIYRLACSQTPSRITPTEEPPDPQPCKPGQAIVWACVRLDGKTIGVEVLGIENDLVWIQALPVVKEDGKLEPQFPFPDGSCNQQVKASDLEHIHIYQDA